MNETKHATATPTDGPVNYAFSGSLVEVGAGDHVFALSRHVDWPVDMPITVRCLTRDEVYMSGRIVLPQDPETFKVTVNVEAFAGEGTSEAWRLTTTGKHEPAEPDPGFHANRPSGFYDTVVAASSVAAVNPLALAIDVMANERTNDRR
jgi:hypothetical protein